MQGLVRRSRLWKTWARLVRGVAPRRALGTVQADPHEWGNAREGARCVRDSCARFSTELPLPTMRHVVTGDMVSHTGWIALRPPVRRLAIHFRRFRTQPVGGPGLLALQPCHAMHPLAITWRHDLSRLPADGTEFPQLSRDAPHRPPPARPPGAAVHDRRVVPPKVRPDLRNENPAERATLMATCRAQAMFFTRDGPRSAFTGTRNAPPPGRRCAPTATRPPPRPPATEP